jgi:ABC-type uncharacterized transport system involved in gliding motility auxiliary subunit
MTTTERVGIAYLQGFGAARLGDVPGLMQSLGDRYDMRALSLGGEDSPTISRDSTEVLVVAGATQPLDSLAVQRIREFTEAGGSALLLIEPVQLDQESPMAIPLESGLEPLLQERGLSLASRLVLDLASSERVNVGQQGFFQVIAPYPLWPIARPAGNHAITNGLNSLTLAWAAPIEIRDSTNVQPLWTTSEAGGLHGVSDPILPTQEWNVPPEELAARTLAVAVTPPEGDTRGRLVVVGDASIMEQQFIQANQGNLAFLANSIDWLAQEEALIRIRSKDRTPPNLVFESDATRNFLKWGNLVGVPLLFVLIGAFRVTGRRRRAESRWREVVAQ